MYAAEVAVDTALGLCVLALFLSLLEKAITMEFMVHSAMGAPGMFFILGGVTLLGSIFVKIFVIFSFFEYNLYKTCRNLDNN